MVAIPVRRVDGEWEDWLPSRGHALYDKFKLLEVQYLAEEYHAQSELLKKLYKSKSEEYFVAKYNGVQSEDGEVVSYCVWSKGVVGLLPKTDKIYFFEPETESITQTEWQDVKKFAGALLIEQEGLYPPRFMVREFPSNEQMKALTAR